MMDPALRQVAQIPLKELWRPTGLLIGPRRCMLKRSEIAELLRMGMVEFVIADVGKPLEWIDTHSCLSFWKNDASSRVVERDSRIELDRYLGGYCYIASQWQDEKFAPPIVLLEKYH